MTSDDLPDECPRGTLRPLRWLVMLPLVLTACTALAPQDSRQHSAAPAPAAPTSADTVRLLAQAPWWTRFDDPLMGTLVTEALQANLDLGIARTRLAQARALRDQTAASRAPQLGSSASLSRNRSSGRTASSYSAGLDASWEADVFGELASAERGARADVATASANLAAARLSVAGEVGLAYVQLRANRARRALTLSSLAAQDETLQLTGWRTQAGLASSLEVEQARASAEQTRAQIPAYDTAIAQGEHALALLLGQDPDALRVRLGDSTRVPVPATDLDDRLRDGLPADLLRQRPDVQAAESAITAELARLDQAQAARRPAFRLSGSLGWQALTLAALGSPGALAAGLAAAVDWPVLDGGRGAAQVQAQQAVLDRARLVYQSAALVAAQDVADAVSALDGSRRQTAALDAATDAARNANRLARQRYEAGLIDFTTLLDTQRTLLSVDNSRAAAAADTSLHLIRLCKALGGDWTDQDPAGRTNP
ncbi:efflux transporter outer membrane subunit [Sphaerotilus sp.]|uniref:efflux transporter outer membrane subunit n=1 Tax=Sphaerotilus sp. TaxID=2093942 RepID=UPI0034E2DE2A